MLKALGLANGKEPPEASWIQSFTIRQFEVGKRRRTALAPFTIASRSTRTDGSACSGAPIVGTALTENTAACPHCALDLSRANAVLGPVPRLSASGLSDLAGVLKTGQPEKILRLLDDFQFRFPQSRLAVVLRNFDPKLPLATHLYWLFNVAPVSGKGNPGGTNRDNPDRNRSASPVGCSHSRLRSRTPPL